MIRKAIIVLLTLGAVWTVVVCVTSGRSARLLFSNRTVTVEVERGGLVISCGAFISDPPRLWVYPQRFRVGSHWVVTVPLWCPFILFFAYPTIAFIRGPVRRWRRYRKGLCVNCGYNLTGNVSGICPECGTKVEQP